MEKKIIIGLIFTISGGVFSLMGYSKISESTNVGFGELLVLLVPLAVFIFGIIQLYKGLKALKKPVK